MSARDAVHTAGYEAVSIQPRGVVFNPDAFFSHLAAAGYAVVPREPHSDMEQPAGELGDDFGISMAAALDVYRRLVAVAAPPAAEEPQP